MKKTSNIFILGIILLFICIIIAYSVTFVNQLTEPLIKLSEENNKKLSFKQIFPNAKNFINITKNNLLSTFIIEIYKATEKNSTLGYLYIVSTNGYSDKIKNLIAIDSKKNTIKSINILYQNETPGLGDKITTNKFKEQYKDIPVDNILTLVKTNNNIKKSDIQAITSSTITSKAVLLGVNTAISDYNKHFKNRR